MLRRKPTRLELKHEDIQEYEEIKKQQEAAKQRLRTPTIVNTQPKTKKTRAQRIGHKAN